MDISGLSAGPAEYLERLGVLGEVVSADILVIWVAVLLKVELLFKGIPVALVLVLKEIVR